MELLYQPEKLIGERYRIVNILGRGGIGVTYLAQDIQNNHHQVALKALIFSQVTNWKVLELFEREAKILAQLNHPQIPRYIDYFQVDSKNNPDVPDVNIGGDGEAPAPLGDRSFYIVQQLAPGKSLANLVETGWRATEAEIKHIAKQILEILVYLHQQIPPVIHRDIKPENLILDSEGKIFLVDFGAVQNTYHSTFARHTTVVGTFGYMAPEQFTGQVVPVTDIYGLGATLLFLLTHRSPADLPQDRLKFNFRSRVEISENFADFLDKCIEPDVAERFASAEMALDVLCDRRKVAKRSSSFRPWRDLVALGVMGIFGLICLNIFGLVLGSLVYHQFCSSNNNALVDEMGHPLIKPSIKFKEFMNICTSNERKEMLGLLFAKGFDVNTKDENGETLMSLADTRELAELLIVKGVNINAKNEDGQTPLHLAAEAKLKEVVEVLLAKGADINAKNRFGETPLHSAALIDGSHTFYSPPRYKASGEPQDVIKPLIAKGADINAVDEDGETPLQLYLASDDFDVNPDTNKSYKIPNKEVVKLLSSQEPDIHAK